MSTAKPAKKAAGTTVHSGTLNGFHIETSERIRLGFGLLEEGEQHMFIFDADADTLDQIVEVVRDTRKALDEKNGTPKKVRKSRTASVSAK